MASGSDDPGRLDRLRGAMGDDDPERHDDLDLDLHARLIRATVERAQDARRALLRPPSSPTRGDP